MTVRRDKRGGDRWVVDVKVRGPSGRVIRKRRNYQGSKRGAERFERELRRSLERGEYDESPDEAPTVAAFAQVYLKDSERANRSPLTLERKERALRVHIVPLLGRVPVDALTARHARRLAAAVEATGGGAGLVRNVLQTLSNLSRCAVSWGYRDALLETPRVSYQPEEVEALTDEEAAALLDVVSSTAWRLPVLLALDAGLRVGEVLGLQWRDVEDGELHIRRQRSRGGEPTLPKSGKPRVVPATPRLLAALEEGKRAPVLGLYVVTTQRGTPQHYDTPRKALARLSERAGRRIGWHVLRHTYATRLVRAGVHLRVVQLLLGHQSITTTERYAHVAPDHLTEAVSRLGRYWGAGSEDDGAEPHGM